MSIINRYNDIKQGCVVMTGNALGYWGVWTVPPGFGPPQAGGGNGADGIGGFISLNTSLVEAGGYPAGSTDIWQQNGSAAIIAIPATANVLYAELIWGGTEKTSQQDITAAVDTPITLIDPLGVSHSIAPDPATAQSMPFVALTAIYERTANVTSIVQQAKGGQYAVQGVPGALGDDGGGGGVFETSQLGWSLIVAYEDKTQPFRSLNIWTSLFIVTDPANPVNVPLSGYYTPAVGTVDGALLAHVQGGDTYFAGDQLLFGPTTTTLTTLSTPNNPATNFFQSQVNYADPCGVGMGTLNTTGTQGTNNAPLNASSANMPLPYRYSTDITGADITGILPNNNTSSVMEFTTQTMAGSRDAYNPMGFAAQIEVNSAQVTPNKTVDKTSVNVGDIITYTVTIPNTGLVSADNINFIDNIPQGTSFVSGSVTVDGVPQPAGTTVVAPTGLNLTPIAPGTTKTVQFQVKVDSVPASGTILNNGTITYTFVPAIGASPIPASNTTNTTLTTVLSNQKSVDKTVVNPGDIITYTATIQNLGTVAASNILFTDPVPSGTSYNDNLTVSTAYTGTTPQTGLTITSIPAGGTVTISWQVKVGSVVPNPNPIPNIATVTVPGGIPAPTNQVNTTVLQNVKSASKTVANVGDTITYTVTITNQGTIAATNVFFQDAVPSGTTYNDNLTVSLPYSGTDPQTGLTITSIPAGGTATITWQVKVGSVLPVPNPILNTGTVTVSGGTPSPTNQVSTTVLDISTVNGNGNGKSVDKAVANTGDILTYTVKINNPGPTAVSNVFFQDAIPSGTTYNDNLTVSLPYTGTDPQTGLTITSIPAGGTATISWQVKVGNTLPVPNPVINTATVTVSGGSPTPTNSVTTTVLDINPANGNGKSVDKTVANTGDIITYTVKIKNPGPTAVSNILFQDAIPSGTTYNNNLTVSLPYTGTTPQTGLTITSIPAGGTVTITWQVKVGSVIPNPNPIPNTGTVTVPGGNPTATNQVTTTVLDINPANGNGKSADKTVANVGDIITYTVKIKNPGLTAVSNILFQDAIPSGTTYNDNLTVSVPYSGTDPQTGLTLTSIPAGATATISWQVKVGSVIPNPNPIPNTGTVTVPGGIPVTTNQVNTAVLNNTKSVDKTTANVGEVVTYTVTITNPGTTAVSNIAFQDPLPSGTTYNDSLTVSTAFTGTDPMTGLTITTINPGETVTIRWQVKIGSTAPTQNPISNTALVTVPGGNPTPTNPVTTTVLQNTKSADKTVVNVGDIITYTATVNNPGTTAVSNILFQDAVPSGTTYNDNLTVSLPYTGTDPQTGLTITSIPAGGTATISWQVKVGSTVPNPNPIANTATVTIPGGTPTPTNPVNTTVLQNIKTVNPQYADVGGIITYTVTLTNPGATDATNVAFQDAIPSGTTYNNNLNVSTAYTGTDPQTGLILTTIKAGTAVTISWQVKVGSTLPVPNPVVNTAVVTVPGGNPAPTNAVTTQINTADINKPGNTSKSADKATTAPGDTVTYTVTVKNTGNVPATGVVVKDVVPTGTTFITGTVTINGTPMPSETPITGINVGTVNPGETKLIAFKVLVGAGAPNPLTNTATVTYTYTPDPNKPPVTPPPVITPPAIVAVKTPQLTINKTSNRTGAQVGDTIIYTLQVQNTGQLTAENIILKDPLTPDVAFADNVTLNGNPISGDITTGINIGNLAVGQTATLTFNATVLSVPSNTTKTIINQATANYQYRANPTDQPISGSNTSNQNQVKVYAPKLTVTKSASLANVLVGVPFTYTITIANTGDIVINNAIVQDTLPAGFTVTGMTLDGAVLTGDLNAGINIGTIAVGQTRIVKVTVVIADTVQQNSFKNVAVVKGTAPIDPNFPPVPVTGTGTDTKGITIYNPKLNLIKSADKTYAVEGDIVTYTVLAQNIGNTILNNVALDNVIVSDILPPELSFIPGSVTVEGIAIPGSNILAGVNIGSLAVGQTKTITFKAQVIGSLKTPIVNEAQANYTFTLPGELPINGETNSNLYSLNVSKVDIQVVKVADKTEVMLGDTLTYTVTLTNDGTVAAYNVVFTDALPEQVQLIQGSFMINGVAVNGVDLTQGIVVGSIAPGQSVTVQYQVKVIGTNCNGMVINQAQVTFDYRLPDGSTGSKQGSGGTTGTNITETAIALTTFKQTSIEAYLVIPTAKPDIEGINTVSGTIEISEAHVITTPQGVSQEGQTLTGYKLVINGILNVVVEYTALDTEQSIHSAHYSVPFSVFIVLPLDYVIGSKLEITGLVEDIYYNAIDTRNFFVNTTDLISVKILGC